MNDIATRITELQAELAAVDERPRVNPLDSSANARYKWLSTLIDELSKYE